MDYLLLIVVVAAPIAYVIYLRRKRNSPGKANAKDGAGYPTFDSSGGDFQDGNDAGPGNGPK